MGLAAAGEARALTALLNAVYVSLHTSDPGTTGAGEVAGGAYARHAATFTQAGANPTVASNNAAVQFVQATADWGTVTHFGIWDSAAAGTFLGGSAVDVAKAVLDGDVARFEAGTLKVTTDD